MLELVILFTLSGILTTHRTHRKNLDTHFENIWPQEVKGHWSCDELVFDYNILKVNGQYAFLSD